MELRDQKIVGFEKWKFDQMDTFEENLKQLRENEFQEFSLEGKNMKKEECKLISELLKNNTSLQILNLGNNSIGNKACKYLCKALNSNNSLKILRLNINNIRIKGSNYLSETLKLNTSLNELYLGNNAIKSEGCKYLSEALKINNSLQLLDLNRNFIQDEGCDYLGEMLKINNSLKELNIGFNDIGPVGCKYLSAALKINKSLKSIKFEGNNIGVEGCKYLSEALQLNYSLQKLDIKNNNIGIEGCKYLSEVLKLNYSLQKINFGDNNIGNEGCKHLSEALEINKSLKSINLEGNNIGIEGCKYLSEVLKTNNSLQILDINNNDIGNKQSKSLLDEKDLINSLQGLYLQYKNIETAEKKELDEKQSNYSLQKLYIESNLIRGEGCKYLSEALKINTSLQELNLGYNNIEIEGCKYLSEALKINNSLQILNLDKNEIEFVGCKYLYEALKINHSLQDLKIHKNNIHDRHILKKIEKKSKTNKENTVLIKLGQIITWKEINEKQFNLKKLIIQNYCLKELKIELKNFNSLEVLDLRNNELNSEFIRNLCQFLKWNPSLKILNLQENKNIGDKEGEEILLTLSFNFRLVECNLNRTSVSNQIQEKIQAKLKENYISTRTIGKTPINKICSKYFEIAELIISNKIGPVKEIMKKNTNNLEFLQEVLFMFCVWNQIELCEFILNQNVFDINFKLDDGNTYLHLNVMKDNYEISKLLIEKGIDINILNNKGKSCKDLCVSDGKCLSLFEDINQLNVVILGKAEIEKSILVKRLLNIKAEEEKSMIRKIYNYFFPSRDLKADGIEMNEAISVSLWDFGGQEFFYSAHQFFLSKKSIHLVFVNLTDLSIERRLFLLLNMIQHRVSKSKVIIIGTHMDEIDPKLMKGELNKISNKVKTIYQKLISNIPKNPSTTNNDNKIELIPCFYWENPSLKEIYSDDKLWFYPISGKEGWNINSLEKIIMTFSFNTIVRKEFISLRDKIISIRNEKLNFGMNPILSKEELKSIILECFDNRNEEILKNMKLLHELGFILDCGNNYEYVIIHPQWLFGVFKSLIPLKNAKVKELNDTIQKVNKRLKEKQKYEDEEFTQLIEKVDEGFVKIEKLAKFVELTAEELQSQNQFLMELLKKYKIVS